MLLLKLELFNGFKINVFNVFQKMIEMFVWIKYKIDKSYEFVLVVVNDDMVWLFGLIFDFCEFCSCFYDLEMVFCFIFNLEGFFSFIQQKIEFLVIENVQMIFLLYVVCIIFVYSCLFCQFQFFLMEFMKKMFQCLYFFFDVVYIYNGIEEKEEEMSWKDMFVFMGSLDIKGISYKYEVVLVGLVLELYNCMVKLLVYFL